MSDRAGGIGYMVKRADGVLAFTRGLWASKAGARAAFLTSINRRRRHRLTWRQCYVRGCRVVMVDAKELR